MFLVTHSDCNEISNNTITEVRDATYFEDIFPCKTRMLGQPVNRSSCSLSDVASTSTSQDEPRRSKRGRVKNDLGKDFFLYLVEGEPSIFAEAMTSPDAPF